MKIFQISYSQLRWDKKTYSKSRDQKFPGKQIFNGNLNLKIITIKLFHYFSKISFSTNAFWAIGDLALYFAMNLVNTKKR